MLQVSCCSSRLHISTFKTTWTLLSLYLFYMDRLGVFLPSLFPSFLPSFLPSWPPFLPSLPPFFHLLVNLLKINKPTFSRQVLSIQKLKAHIYEFFWGRQILNHCPTFEALWGHTRRKIQVDISINRMCASVGNTKGQSKGSETWHGQLHWRGMGSGWLNRDCHSYPWVHAGTTNVDFPTQELTPCSALC